VLVCPLVILVGAGQAGDNPVFEHLLDHLNVSRSAGVPRTRPDRVGAEQAYSSRHNRSLLRRRRIGAVISEPGDQQGHCKRR
jgi:hypothetical protein